MLPYLTTHFGNPSSAHPYTEPARAALAWARRQVGALTGAAPRVVRINMATTR
jgi:cysteine desulfurase